MIVSSRKIHNYIQLKTIFDDKYYYKFKDEQTDEEIIYFDK